MIPMEKIKALKEKLRVQSRKSCYVHVRCTAAEKKYLEAQANAAGLTVSELLRRKILEIKIVPRSTTQVLDQLKLIQMLLMKLGGLFKHLYNVNPIYSEETAMNLKASMKEWEKISALIDEVKINPKQKISIADLQLKAEKID